MYCHYAELSEKSNLYFINFISISAFATIFKFVIGQEISFGMQV
jgi:hypothetical protein